MVMGADLRPAISFIYAGSYLKKVCFTIIDYFYFLLSSILSKFINVTPETIVFRPFYMTSKLLIIIKALPLYTLARR